VQHGITDTMIIVIQVF